MTGSNPGEDTAQQQTWRHPLDPLTAEEITQTTHILQASGRLTPRMRLMAYTLREPEKTFVLAFQAGQTVPREVSVVIRDHERRLTIEATVSLNDEAIRAWHERDDVQPALTYPEVFAAQEAILGDAAFQAALELRGITDLTTVVLYPWTAGYPESEESAAQGRLIRMEAALCLAPTDNYYAHPVEGIVATVELDTMTVRIEDHGAVPVPTHSGNYTPEGIQAATNSPSFPAGPRTDVKPISITQPEGVSFQVQGQQVSWQKWRLRVGFTPREGLVLHLVEYQDRERRRPILYRASLSEMYVPYGDPTPSHNFKNVFDAGEVGMGVLANSLELGCDCLGEIHYFDACVNDAEGQALVLTNAICMHEEDFSILWKHLEYNEDGSTRAEVRRSRRLVISSISTVGNYEYGFYWYLYQDGTIQYEVKLTGIIAPAAIAAGEQPASGTLVAPGVYGPHHQHYFNVRLDSMIDGLHNSVVEVNCESLPWGPENPRGNAWVARETLLASESVAQRSIEPRTARYWKIVNRASRNALGQVVGYKLMPDKNVFPFFAQGSPQWERGGFVRNHLWVTAYDPAERYAAGDYPNQQTGGDGLPSYVQKDRSLEQTDLVVWYTFGSNHVTRPEDWPVMPVETVGFTLKPVSFFDGNPALDVPATEHCNHHS
ncbi:MAG TPA: primary-amine oxidase [Ktedonobacteraceae bacterium]|nr:primary-amine oxidase [Ktedonobacteraceae bacterium]